MNNPMQSEWAKELSGVLWSDINSVIVLYGGRVL